MPHNGEVRPPAPLVALACAAGLAVAGCGGADEASAPPAATAPSTGDAAATSAPADLRGVAIAVRRDPG